MLEESSEQVGEDDDSFLSCHVRKDECRRRTTSPSGRERAKCATKARREAAASHLFAIAKSLHSLQLKRYTVCLGLVSRTDTLAMAYNSGYNPDALPA